ncbi:MAG: SAP domain-containing protein, partial [Nocardioides sp.]
TKLAKAGRKKAQSDVSSAVGLPAVVPAETVPSTETAPSTKESTRTPDHSWTVIELRQEARSRGLTGLSRKTKAELIAALT